MESFGSLLESGDFEGAEEILASGMGASPKYAPFIHLQYGRLYTRWNKLSSAINHLVKAAELAKAGGDEMFLIQVTEELKWVKKRQSTQTP